MFPKIFSLAIKPYCILLLGAKVFVFILNPEVLTTDACELLISSVNTSQLQVYIWTCLVLYSAKDSNPEPQLCYTRTPSLRNDTLTLSDPELSSADEYCGYQCRI